MTALDMDALTPRQRDVLGQIACGQDQGHPDATLIALAKRELIIGYVDELPGWPPVQITRWNVPVNIHMQWAAWCATQPDDPDETG